MSLEKLKEYKHIGTIERFKIEHPKLKDRAEEIFEDLMVFFWASKKHQRDRKEQPQNDDFNFIYIMDDAMKPIDQMWHIFLLWTEDYMSFCFNHFGEFLHHRPGIVPGLPKEEDFFEKNLTKFLSYTYDNLGEETVKRWFNVAS